MLALVLALALRDSDVHTLGDTSAFVNPTGQLYIVTRRGKTTTYTKSSIPALCLTHLLFSMEPCGISEDWRTVKEWNRRLKEECEGKSSLRWLHLPPDEQLHIIWRDMDCQSHTRKATIKAMMTTGVTSSRLLLNGSTKTMSTPHVSSAISVNPRTSTTSCAGVPPSRLRTPESASYRYSSGYFTLHWVLRDATNIPSTMRSSNWH